MIKAEEHEPGGIRTHDLLIRSQTLYPAELRAHDVRDAGKNEPGGIRTHDLLIRSQTLYPAELRAHMLHQNRISAVLFLTALIFYHDPSDLSSQFFIFLYFQQKIFRSRSTSRRNCLRIDAEQPDFTCERLGILHRADKVRRVHLPLKVRRKEILERCFRHRAAFNA